MAAGTIVTVLTKIPWGQVIQTAPKVADAAIKLWESVGNQKSKAAQQIAAAQRSAMSEAELLKTDVGALKQSVRTLHEQMKESTEVIKELAAQNALLVERVELSRKRTLALALASGVAFAVLAGLLVMQLALT